MVTCDWEKSLKTGGRETSLLSTRGGPREKKKKDGQSLLDPWEDDGEAHFGNIFHARIVQENQ